MLLVVIVSFAFPLRVLSIREKRKKGRASISGSHAVNPSLPSVVFSQLDKSHKQIYARQQRTFHLPVRHLPNQDRHDGAECLEYSKQERACVCVPFCDLSNQQSIHFRMCVCVRVCVRRRRVRFVFLSRRKQVPKKEEKAFHWRERKKAREEQRSFVRLKSQPAEEKRNRATKQPTTINNQPNPTGP